MRSPKMLLLIGLATFIMVAPTGNASKIVADYETVNQTPTITNEKIDEVEFVSTHQEEIIEVKQEKWKEINVHISYYTSLICENTSYGSVDAQGNQLVYGTIAIPRDLPLGTRFKLDGFDGEFIGRDRGSKKYIKWLDSNTMKVDMFIPRNKGENDNTYYKRVNNMGITKTTGRYLIKDGE